MKKLIMTTKDVQIITEKSDGYCRRIRRIIKKELNKQNHQKITITEFCTYYGFDEAVVRARLTSFYTKNKAA